MEKRKLIENARELRREMTKAESVFWTFVRSRNVRGIKIRRQHPVGSWILDFYWAEKKVAIEIDGGIHQRTDVKGNDEMRTIELEKLGIRVIRFTNEEVLEDIGKVVRKMIAFAVE